MPEEKQAQTPKTKESAPVRNGGFFDDGDDDFLPPIKKMPSVKFSPTSGDPSKKTHTETEI